MKKLYLNPFQFLRFLLPMSVLFLNALHPGAAYGQSYYSTFSNLTGKFTVTLPSGDDCNAPAVQNTEAFADAGVNNYTAISGKITSPLTCTNSDYVFTTKLKLSQDSSFVSAGLVAGFRLKLSSPVSVNLLKKYLSVQTFLDNTMADNFSGNDIHFIDVATDSTRFVVYGTTTKKFNQVQLVVNSNIFPLNTDFEFDIYYAMASNLNLLPVTINNYKATASGNNVNISWQSLNEINIANYRIEKSSNNGVSYTTVATLPAKGGSDALFYSYTDKSVSNGNYLYRIVPSDKDMHSKPTNAVLVTIAGKVDLKLMPSIVKAGQRIALNSGIAGAFHLAVYDLQGRVVKQQQVNGGDQATINTAGLSAGTYVVKILTAAGNISEVKFVVN